MIRQIEESDTKGWIIIPKDKLRSLWSFKRDGRKEGYDARIMRIDAKFIYMPLCPML